MFNTYFDKVAFTNELLSVFFIVFLSFVWMLYVRIKNIKKVMTALAIGFAAITFITAFAMWGIGKLYTKDPVIPLMNPMFIFLHTVLQGADVENMQVTMVWKGVPYLLGAQFLGGLIGYAFFAGYFYLWRLYNKETNDENLKSITIGELSRIPGLDKKWVALKEFVFITSFMFIVPFVSYALPPTNMINQIWLWFIIFILLSTILLTSVFLNLFAFHYFFAILSFIWWVIYVTKNKLWKDKWIIAVNEFAIVLYTVLIPIIVGYLAVYIAHVHNPTMVF